MVDHLSRYGDCLGTVNGHTFHKFPSIEQLSDADETTLRAAGFGYRAKYIEGTVKVGAERIWQSLLWLRSCACHLYVPFRRRCFQQKSFKCIHGFLECVLRDFWLLKGTGGIACCFCRFTGGNELFLALILDTRRRFDVQEVVTALRDPFR